ncbi:peptidoglycan-binding protein [Streptomyces rimosus]|uniref:peptidoglycan-binding protein n=1 Tax=Streptomyces rimosus TaxID=1927 RepID=UPI0004CB78F6|nr:peptidoglycan-binding protein [Streptomyces rimosus]
MSRWKELPASTDQRTRQLVTQLRRLKDHSGLSLATLAARTAYSKSSWERYLNGKKLPPRAAVESLARVCGTDPTRLLALQEVAAEGWGWESGAKTETEVEAAGGVGAAGLRAGDTEPGPVRAEGARPENVRRRRSPTRTAVLATAALLIAALAARLLISRPWQDDTPPAVQPSASPGAFVHEPGKAFDCRVHRAHGVLTADRSATTQAILANGTSGWGVVEAQCLLRHRGFDPGAVDGIVGENTIRAVKRFQTKSGLPADGIVGPDTWEALRR